MTDDNLDSLPPEFAEVLNREFAAQQAVDDTADLTPIEALERRHGFTFGGEHDSAGAPPTLALICTNLTCPNRGQHIQLHADTALPAHCGGCGGVLHCDHTDATTAEHHEGTLREPRRIVRTVCTACGTELHRDEQSLAPIAVEDIPLHLLGGVNLDAIARDRTEGAS